MNASSIFSFGNSFVLLGWLLLIFVPNWKFTQTIILNGIIVLFAILYSFLILKDIGDFKADSFSTLANVKALFQNDNAVAAGWMHYLAFDLFVGAYIVRKSKEYKDLVKLLKHIENKYDNLIIKQNIYTEII